MRINRKKWRRKDNAAKYYCRFSDNRSGKYYFNLKMIYQKYTSRQRDDFRSRNIGIIVQDYAVINELTAKKI